MSRPASGVATTRAKSATTIAPIVSHLQPTALGPVVASIIWYKVKAMA